MASWECKEQPKRTLEPCGCMPPGFSRLRYFFGKHLSAADFTDEQRYHVAKLRFHNQRLHGVGVLCGLGVTQLDPDSAVIRVVRGAALDPCGREILVAWDQCIDVDAWYQSHREELESKYGDCKEPDEEHEDKGKLSLCVAVRYAECPTAPEPAPRDPCACAEGGCDYGRVSEQFELRLMTESEAATLTAHDSFPTQDQIAKALADPLGAENLLHRLAQPITKGCPPPSEEAWVMLGCFVAILNNDRSAVTGLEEVGEVHAPPVLLSTEVIQSLLARLYADFDPNSGGPSIREVLFEEVATADPAHPNYRFILKLSDSINSDTIDANGSIRLRMLGATGWDPPGDDVVEMSYAENATYGSHLNVFVDNESDYLVEHGRYHLYFDPVANPIVDDELRMLRPRNYVLRFKLETDSYGKLNMTRLPS